MIAKVVLEQVVPNELQSWSEMANQGDQAGLEPATRRIRAPTPEPLGHRGEGVMTI